MIEGEKVRIKTIGRDEYGRSIAKVYKGRKLINKILKEKLKY